MTRMLAAALATLSSVRCCCASKATVAIFGDSISAGPGYCETYPACPGRNTGQALAASLRSARVINLATGGESSANADDGSPIDGAHPIAYGPNFRAWVSANRPDVVVLRWGVAEAVKLGTPGPSVDRIMSLASYARSAGARVLIVGLSHVSASHHWAGQYAGHAAEINSGLASGAKAGGFEFVDIRSVVPSDDADVPDGLHPTTDYADRMNAALAAAIGL